MNKAIELRLKYVDLVTSGKKDEAWGVLQEIWSLDKGKPKNKSNSKINKKEENKNAKTPRQKEKTEKEIKIPSKFKKIKDLQKIHGVGPKTVEELKEIYGDLDGLVKGLKAKPDITTRDDIEGKIREALNI